MFTLSWSYGDGERAGVLQKFSRKGWICKTYEGELALYVVGGVSPEIWYFSVRDESLAPAINQVIGERVRLHYSEHPLVPTSCFAGDALLRGPDRPDQGFEQLPGRPRSAAVIAATAVPSRCRRRVV